MMTDKKLDKLLRDKFAGYEEAAPDVWGGIQSGLASRRRWRVVRRASYVAAAAAACLAFVLLLSKDPEQATPEVTVPVQLAQQVESAQQPAETEAVAPMAEQIKKFSKAVAAVSVANETAPVAESELESELESEAEPVTEPAAKEQTAEPRSENQSVQARQWSEADFEIETRHTSHISISTNLSPSLSKDGSSLPSGPMYAPGAGGKSADVIEVAGEARHYMPLNFGVQFRTQIAGKFYVGAGLNYTYLHSKYAALVNKVYYDEVRSSQHYIGIPVNFYYNFIDSGNWSLYANVGGTVEKCVGQKFSYADKTISSTVKGVQFSVLGGVGVEYRFVPYCGVYLDPSVVYYFDCDQPLSIRTQQPFMARLELGFRFNF